MSINTLSIAHVRDTLQSLLDTANNAVDRHSETARNLTITLKVQLKFDKDMVRSEWRASGSVDIPDGELDSEIKRTDSVFLCTLHNGEAGQQRLAGT